MVAVGYVEPVLAFVKLFPWGFIPFLSHGVIVRLSLFIPLFLLYSYHVMRARIARASSDYESGEVLLLHRIIERTWGDTKRQETYLSSLAFAWNVLYGSAEPSRKAIRQSRLRFLLLNHAAAFFVVIPPCAFERWWGTMLPSSNWKAPIGHQTEIM